MGRSVPQICLLGLLLKSLAAKEVTETRNVDNPDANFRQPTQWIPVPIAPGPVMGMNTWSSGSCAGYVQRPLRFGCSFAGDLADAVCCHDADLNEPIGFFGRVGRPSGLFAQVDSFGVTTFYDSVCGKPLFRAPVNRSFAEWKAETGRHGWPSFRAEEIIQENLKMDSGGAVRSVCGTHLGNNLPDEFGDRYRINLLCIAGRPTQTEAVSLGASFARSFDSPWFAATALALTALAAIMAVRYTSDLSSSSHSGRQPLLEC